MAVPYHPLILCNIARPRRCTVSTASTTPKPLRRWLHRIGTHSRFSRQDTGYAQSLMLCKHSLWCHLYFTSKVAERLSRRASPSRSRLMPIYKEGSRFQCRSGRFFKWPVTGLPEKDSQEGNPTTGSGCPFMGSASFWPTAGEANWIRERFTGTRHHTWSGAIRRPNKSVPSTATSRHF